MATINGAFNLSVTAYSLARKGKVTRLGETPDVTFAGDVRAPFTYDDGAPVIVVTYRHGNGGWTSYRPNAAAEKRLTSLGITAEFAVKLEYLFGVSYDADGRETAVFPVDHRWDGYLHHGYSRATISQLITFYGSLAAAAQMWDRRFDTGVMWNQTPVYEA